MPLSNKIIIFLLIFLILPSGCSSVYKKTWYPSPPPTTGNNNPPKPEKKEKIASKTPDNNISIITEKSPPRPTPPPIQEQKPVEQKSDNQETKAKTSNFENKKDEEKSTTPEKAEKPVSPKKPIANNESPNSNLIVENKKEDIQKKEVIKEDVAIKSITTKKPVKKKESLAKSPSTEIKEKSKEISSEVSTSNKKEITQKSAKKTNLPPKQKKVAKKENFLAPKPAIPKENPIPEIDPSTIIVPVTISLGDVINILQLEANTPKGEDFNENWGPFPTWDSPKALKYKWDRENFILTTNGNKSDFTSNFKYQLEYAEKRNRPYPPFTCCIWDTITACGQQDPLPSTDVVLRSEFSLQSDWRLLSRSEVTTENPKGCTEAGTKPEIINLIQSRLTKQLEEFAKNLDDRSPKFVNLRPFAQTAWSMLNRPISINPKEDVWLAIKPSKVRVTPINLDATNASLSIGIEANPQVIIGFHPTLKSQPLPDILLGDPSGNSTILTNMALSFIDAAKEIENNVTKKPLPYFGKRKVNIKNVHVYGNSLKTVIELDLIGAFSGRIYLSGKPQYDEKENKLSIPDLDFDLNTRDWLTKNAKWLLEKDFISDLRSNTSWDLTKKKKESLNFTHMALNKEFSQKERFSGEIKDVKYIGVNSTKDSFLIYLTATSELKFFLE